MTQGETAGEGVSADEQASLKAASEPTPVPLPDGTAAHVTIGGAQGSGATAEPVKQDEFMDSIDPKPDPLNAAIAATAGEPPPGNEELLDKALVPGETPRTTIELAIPASAEERIAAEGKAMEAYIQAGVAKASAAVGSAEIVTAAAFKAALESLLRHLHLDHPENYLPKG